MSGTDTRLCLFHVPKTGGTSLRIAFVNVLSQCRCFLCPNNITLQYYSVQHFQSLFEKHRQHVVFVSGNFTICDLDLLPGLTPCVVLRELNDRAVSVVRHFMRQDPASFRETLDAIGDRQIRDFFRNWLGVPGPGRGDAPINAVLAGHGVDRFAPRVGWEVLGVDLDIQRLNAAPGVLAKIRVLTGLDAEIYTSARAAISGAA